jgi:hypothetical protein
MKALRFNSFGNLSELRLEEVPTPSRGEARCLKDCEMLFGRRLLLTGISNLLFCENGRGQVQ